MLLKDNVWARPGSDGKKEVLWVEFLQMGKAVKLSILPTPRVFSFSYFAILQLHQGNWTYGEKLHQFWGDEMWPCSGRWDMPAEIETKPFIKGLENSLMICVQLIAIQYENVFY